MKSNADQPQFWSQGGEMGFWSHRVQSAADGTFRIPLKGTRNHHLLAMDPAREPAKEADRPIDAYRVSSCGS